MNMGKTGRVDILKLALGSLTCLMGGLIGALLLLEKSNSYAILKIGTSIHEAVFAGIVCTAPGVALILRAIPSLESTGKPRTLSPRLELTVHLIILGAAATSLAYLVYFSFGLPPAAQIPKSVLSSDIAKPLTDLFHEGEIIGSIGFFTGDFKHDYPLLIHGPGRNLLPAWIAVGTGSADTMIATMRFVTAAGTFLSFFLCAAAAAVVAAILFARQSLVCLSRTEVLVFGLVTAMIAMTGMAIFGVMTNRELVRMAVQLISVGLIWAAAAERFPLAKALSFALGFITMLSPLHTYLAAVQSVLLACAAAGISLVILTRNRTTVLLCGILGAITAFLLVLFFGMLGFVEDGIFAVLYWAREGSHIWALPAPKPVLLSSIGLMLAGAGLLGLSFAGPDIKLEDKAVRGLFAFLAVVIIVSTLSYANRSDVAHLSFALISMAPAFAALLAMILAVTRSVTRAGALAFATLLTCISAPMAMTMEGSGIRRALQQIETPDSQIVPPAVHAFRDTFGSMLELQDCLLILSNEGGLGYVSGLPPCGPVFYPIYANADADLALAAWLQENPQNLVVAESESDWSRIDNRSMRERLPRTYEVIDKTYPVSRKFGIWELRFSSPTP